MRFADRHLYPCAPAIDGCRNKSIAGGCVEPGFAVSIITPTQ